MMLFILTWLSTFIGASLQPLLFFVFCSKIFWLAVLVLLVSLTSLSSLDSLDCPWLLYPLSCITSIFEPLLAHNAKLLSTV